MRVGITYIAIATVDVDPPSLDPAKLADYLRNSTPEVLRADVQQLVAITSVLVGEEEVPVDLDFA